MSRLRLIALIVALPFGLWLFLPVLSDGAPLQSRIEEKRRAIERKKAKERVLTTTISRRASARSWRGCRTCCARSASGS